MTSRRHQLEQLADSIRAVEQRGWMEAGAGSKHAGRDREGDRHARHASVETGWPAIDDALGGGLRRGVIHEWLGTAAPRPAAEPEAGTAGYGEEAPPMRDARHGQAGQAGQASPEVSYPIGRDGASIMAVRSVEGVGVFVDARTGQRSGSTVSDGSRTRSAASAAHAGAFRRWLPPLCVLVHLAGCAARGAACAARTPHEENREPAGAEPGRAFHHDARKANEASPDRSRLTRVPGSTVIPSPPGVTVWIGRRCWPFPVLLARGAGWAAGALSAGTGTDGAIGRSVVRSSAGGITCAEAISGVFRPEPAAGRSDVNGRASALQRWWLHQSIFVDPSCEADRAWAIDLALRSAAVSAVVADGTGLRMAETRRFQLAAESGRALAIIVRPPRELDMLSAATTRWLVRAAPTGSAHPRWTVQLLRCKGVQPAQAGERQEGRVRRGRSTMYASPAESLPGSLQPWLLEYDGASGAVREPADMVGRRRAAPCESRVIVRSA